MQPLLHWKINTYYVFWVCVYSLRCTEFQAHAPYWHLWPVWPYNIFFLSNYLTNGTIFEKEMLLNIFDVILTVHRR